MKCFDDDFRFVYIGPKGSWFVLQLVRKKDDIQRNSVYPAKSGPLEFPISHNLLNSIYSASDYPVNLIHPAINFGPVKQNPSFLTLYNRFSQKSILMDFELRDFGKNLIVKYNLLNVINE